MFVIGRKRYISPPRSAPHSVFRRCRIPPPFVKGRTGLTLVEIIIAMTVFAIAIVALVSSIFHSAIFSQSTRNYVLAQNAARKKIEEMRGQTFSDIYKIYNSNPNDDPNGPGTSPGATFTVADLNQVAAGVPIGQVSFPEGAVGPGTGLVEYIADATLGMPRDLNGDGGTDMANHSSDYKLLPAKVTIQWSDGDRRRQITLYTLMTDR